MTTTALPDDQQLTCVKALPPGIRARDPRCYALVAWFDGHAQAEGFRPMTHDRELTDCCLAHWRQGHAEGQACVTEQRRRRGW